MGQRRRSSIGLEIGDGKFGEICCYTRYKALQDEAVKQRESLVKEVVILRGELQQAREDRDRQLSKVQASTADLAKYKESTGKSVAELDNLTIKSNALEERCYSQVTQIRVLQHQLAAANEKLKMANLSTSEIRTEFEEQKQVVVNYRSDLGMQSIKLAKEKS